MKESEGKYMAQFQMAEFWQVTRNNHDPVVKKLISSFFTQRLSEDCRHQIMRHCVKSSGDERRLIVELFHKHFEELSFVEDVGVQIDRASDIFYFLASESNFGLHLLVECANSVLELYARILSYFLQRSWVEREATLRHTILSLLALVKFNWVEVTKKVERLSDNVARSVRRLMMRDLPTNVMLDCGVIVVETDLRRNRNRLTSSLWLLKNYEDAESVIFIALCYGTLIVTSPQFFSKMMRREKNTVKQEPLVPLSTIMRCASSGNRNDGRYLLAVFKFFEIFTRKIRFVDLAFDSHFLESLVNFLWQHCDHFVDTIRALSRQCLKNSLLQSDRKVTEEIQKLLMKTDNADERLCYVIVNSCSTELANNDYFSNHCFHLVTHQLKQTENSLSLSWMTKAYVTLLTSAYREEFDFWFDRWIRPIWELSDELTFAFRRDVIVAAVTVCPQSLQILIARAAEEQLSSILDCVLLIEDKEVRRKRINTIDPRILISIAPSNPLAVITFISERKDTKSCIESLRASIDAIFCCNRDYQRRIFVHKFKNITMDEDDALWIQKRCFSNLFAGASFDRRHSALLLLETLSQPLKNCNFDQLRGLFTCLGDSYLENQSLAFQLLKPVAGNLCGGNQLRSICTFLIEAIFEANVSEHDTCAFVSQLLCYLPPGELNFLSEFTPFFDVKLDLLAVKENDGTFYTYLTFLLEVVKSRFKKFDTSPFYGVLRVIRHIVEHTQFSLDKFELSSELAKTCVECNLQVLSVVTQSSPEGFLPSNELTKLDETDELLLYMNSQKALLRGWRTVKETSLLLKYLLSVEEFDQNIMEFIGTHIKTLLFELKHKGAIEVVYEAANTFCYVCVRSTNEYLRDIPRRWLQEIVELIINGDEGSICRWRRSAGIPFIAQAVLNANSIQSDILCHQLAKQLLQIYRNDDIKEESKIHSANVLRILFKNKNLTQKVDNHLEITLRVAIDGVASSSWNMRNVSWLLLGSVISRALELNNQGPNAISFFRKFPSLYDFFCQRLRGCDRSQLKNQSSVFAVLLFLASFQPSNECDYNDGGHNALLTSIWPLVYGCGGSPIWKIRITAARAIRALVTRDSYVVFISAICTNVKSPLEQNSFHGSFLQMEILLRLRWQMSSGEKYYLRNILIDFVADTNFILKSDKNSVPVRKQIFVLHTLIFKKLTEWKLDDDGAFASYATVHWPQKSNRAPSYLDDGTFNQSWMIHLISHQLYATLDLDQLEKLLEYCSLHLPAVATAVLETFLQPTSRYLEANDSIGHLRDYFLILNPIDRNRIIRRITQSQSLCRLLNAFVRDCVAQKTYPFEGISILSYLTESEFFELLAVDEIESLCSLVGDDEEAFSAITNYLSRTLKFWVIHSQNDLLRILRSVCTLDTTLVASHCRAKQIALYDNFLPRIRGSDDISTVLNVWSQKLAFATCEKPSSLDALLRHFYLDSLSLYEPCTCAVALVGWSLANVGIIWDRIKSQAVPSAFGENLPARFENRILLSRICTKLLRELLHSHSELPRSILDTRLTLWLRSHCHISPAESIFTLVDIVSFFSEIRDNLASSFNECVASYLYRGTVFKRFAIDNIGLVISAFENCR